MTDLDSQPNTNIFIGDLPTEYTEDQLRQIFATYGGIASTKLIPGSKGTNAMLIRFLDLTDAVWLKENLNGNIPQGLTTPVYVNYNKGARKGKGKDGGKDGGKWGMGFGKAVAFGKDGGFGKGGFGKDGGKDGGAQWGPYGGCDGGESWWGAPAAASSWGGKGKGSVKGGSVHELKNSMVESGILGKWQQDVHAVYVHGIPNDSTDVDLYHIFSPFGAIPAFGCRAMVNEDGSCKGFGFVNFSDSMSAEMAIMTLNGTQLPNGKTLTVSFKQKKGTAPGWQAQTAFPNAVQVPAIASGMEGMDAMQNLMQQSAAATADGGMDQSTMQYGEAMLQEMQVQDGPSIPAAFQKN